MKQNEPKNDEKTESSQWQTPILDEIDVALLTQNGTSGPGDFASSS